MDGLQVMEEDSGLILSFSPHIVSLPIGVSRHQVTALFWHGPVFLPHIFMTTYAQDPCIPRIPSCPPVSQQGPALLFCSANPRWPLQLYT